MEYPKVAGGSVSFKENFDSVSSVTSNGGINISANATISGGIMTSTGGGVDYNFPDMDEFFIRGGSIVLKFKIDSGTNANYKRIFVYRLNDNYSIDILSQQSTGQISAQIQNGVGDTQYTITWAGTLNAYITVTIVWDKANLTIYGYEGTTLKNNSSTAGVTSINLDTTSQTIRLGNSSISAANNFVGYFDNCSIYIGNILSLGEITDIVNLTTFTEVDASDALIWLPCVSQYNDGSNQVTENIGSLGGTVTSGDGSTVNTFPAQVNPSGFNYDGVNTYLNAGSNSSIANIFDGGGSFTVWIKVDSVGESSFPRIIDKVQWAVIVTNPDASNTFLEARFDQAFSVSAGSWSENTTRNIQIGKWIHIAVVYDNTLGANVPVVYVNGRSIVMSTDTVPGSDSRTSDSSNSLIIGDRSSTFGRAFDGVISKLSLWDNMLTATQVNYLYEKGRRELGQ